MKKAILLSVVASGFALAGGNIAPAAPVAPTPAVAPAACDFWGQIGFRYEFKSDHAGKGLAKTAHNGAKSTVVMGVEKEVGNGFGLGAEVAATIKFDGKLKKKSEDAELSQLYLTYKNGKTAVKAGRQALPKSVSPWAWSDDSLGRKDNTFNAITVVNTALDNTTLVGAWVPQVVSGAKTTKINGSTKGLFMLTVMNKSVVDLSTSLYFMPKNNANGKAMSVWTSVKGKVSGVKVGAQAVYAKADAGSMAQKGTGTKATFGVSAFAKTSISGVSTKLTLAYLNAGNATLNLGGTSGFWGAFGKDVSPENGKQKIAKLDLGYKLSGGKLYSGLAMDKPDTGKTAFEAKIGYKFKVSKVSYKVEYRFQKNSKFASTKDHRVRLEAKYKF